MTTAHKHRTVRTEVFGEFARYKLIECLTRFGTTHFMVEDAETPDPVTGLPAVIRQADTREEATAGLV